MSQILTKAECPICRSKFEVVAYDDSAAKDARIAALEAENDRTLEMLGAFKRELSKQKEDEITNLKGLLRETRPYVGSWGDQEDKDLLSRIDSAITDKE